MKFSSVIKSIRLDLGSEKITLKIILKNYLWNPSFRLLLNFRLGKYFFLSKNKVFKAVGMYYKMKQLTKRNCQISYYCEIGSGVKFPHPIGIVIGDGVIIKNNVKIWQNVTLGSHGKIGNNSQYPVVENCVRIFPGSIIYGPVKIGENVTIGANLTINKDVPDNHTISSSNSRNEFF